MTAETLRLRGLPASPGLAAGPLVRISSAVAAPRAAGSPQDERAALDRAIGAASAELRALADRQTDSAGEILEFQLALLEDEELRNPAFDDIDKGAPAARAWEGALGRQIESYATAEDDYFRARASDLIDLRDRVLRALAGGDPVVFAAPDGAIVVADDLAPSLFLEIDWGRAAGAALMAGSAQSHVAMLARARGVPMVVGLGEIGAPDGETVLLDGERGEIEIAPSSLRVAEWRLRTAGLADRRAEENRRVGGPALTRTGKRIRALVNIHSLADLTPDAALAERMASVSCGRNFCSRLAARCLTKNPSMAPIAPSSTGRARNPSRSARSTRAATNRSQASLLTAKPIHFSASGDYACRCGGRSCSRRSCGRLRAPPPMAPSGSCCRW